MAYDRDGSIARAQSSRAVGARAGPYTQACRPARSHPPIRPVTREPSSCLEIAHTGPKLLPASDEGLLSPANVDRTHRRFQTKPYAIRPAPARLNTNPRKTEIHSFQRERGQRPAQSIEFIPCVAGVMSVQERSPCARLGKRA